jgi:plasmid stabilization system protein ParE
MSLPLVIRPAAQAELDAAAAWYEGQQPGLGAALVAAVQQVFDTITTTPQRYPIVHADVRETVVPRFPYCVYYRERAGRVVVIAVFHTSRDPSVWQSRP